MESKAAISHVEISTGGSVDKLDESAGFTNPSHDRAIALAMARAADPGPRAFSPRAIQLLCIVLVVCMCSGDSGFDGTVMGAINSMIQFQAYFGLEGAAKSTGIVFGMYTVGQVAAAFLAAYLPDKFGRRWGMFIGNIILVVGAFLCGFSKNMGMLLAGRFLVGMGCSAAAAAGKSYLSEITSPWNRGRYMGLQNSFYYVGQLLASGIAIPMGRMATDWSWRVPMILQCMLAVINIAFVLFLPESPRWLFSRGHEEEAIKILAKLHSQDNDVNSPLVQMEVSEFRDSIALDGADQRWWDFRPLFNSHSGRYRFGMCVIVSCWGQLSGNGLITYYLPSLLQLAGIVNRDRQRVLNFVNSITSFAAALTGTAIVDKVGRRKLMLTAAISCTCGLAIVAGLLSDAGHKNAMRANAGITFIYLFMMCYSFGWTPLQGLYPAECLAFEVRAKGLALQGWFTNVFSLINTFGLPSALKALSWKTYLIFMVWDIVGVAVIYLFTVETKQLSLEELDEVFESKNPKKTSFALSAAARERAAEERKVLAAAGL
ncbi:hypothetical protein CcaverHIS631_0109010 [Cutaneotrichosporon cavernicola]|nr:hypothetical protein CcaverHIS631_0109010 [Cutaneotrichosporon cavernicola]BEJ03726.1 hypothetical protein CcaverHIS641_0109010 [Cutaneotrichosporon cavernicola]